MDRAKAFPDPELTPMVIQSALLTSGERIYLTSPQVAARIDEAAEQQPFAKAAQRRIGAKRLELRECCGKLVLVASLHDNPENPQERVMVLPWATVSLLMYGGVSDGS